MLNLQEGSDDLEFVVAVSQSLFKFLLMKQLLKSLSLLRESGAVEVISSVVGSVATDGVFTNIYWSCSHLLCPISPVQLSR